MLLVKSLKLPDSSEQLATFVSESHEITISAFTVPSAFTKLLASFKELFNTEFSRKIPGNFAPSAVLSKDIVPLGHSLVGNTLDSQHDVLPLLTQQIEIPTIKTRTIHFEQLVYVKCPSDKTRAATDKSFHSIEISIILVVSTVLGSDSVLRDPPTYGVGPLEGRLAYVEVGRYKIMAAPGLALMVRGKKPKTVEELFLVELEKRLKTKLFDLNLAAMIDSPVSFALNVRKLKIGFQNVSYPLEMNTIRTMRGLRRVLELSSESKIMINNKFDELEGLPSNGDDSILRPESLDNTVTASSDFILSNALAQSRGTHSLDTFPRLWILVELLLESGQMSLNMENILTSIRKFGWLQTPDHKCLSPEFFDKFFIIEDGMVKFNAGVRSEIEISKQNNNHKLVASIVDTLSIRDVTTGRDDVLDIRVSGDRTLFGDFCANYVSPDERSVTPESERSCSSAASTRSDETDLPELASVGTEHDSGEWEINLPDTARGPNLPHTDYRDPNCRCEFSPLKALRYRYQQDTPDTSDLRLQNFCIPTCQCPLDECCRMENFEIDVRSVETQIRDEQIEKMNLGLKRKCGVTCYEERECLCDLRCKKHEEYSCEEKECKGDAAISPLKLIDHDFKYPGPKVRNALPKVAQVKIEGDEVTNLVIVQEDTDEENKADRDDDNRFRRQAQQIDEEEALRKFREERARARDNTSARARAAPPISIPVTRSLERPSRADTGSPFEPGIDGRFDLFREKGLERGKLQRRELSALGGQAVQLSRRSAITSPTFLMSSTRLSQGLRESSSQFLRRQTNVSPLTPLDESVISAPALDSPGQHQSPAVTEPLQNVAESSLYQPAPTPTQSSFRQTSAPANKTVITIGSQEQIRPEGILDPQVSAPGAGVGSNSGSGRGRAAGRGAGAGPGPGVGNAYVGVGGVRPTPGNDPYGLQPAAQTPFSAVTRHGVPLHQQATDQQLGLARQDSVIRQLEYEKATSDTKVMNIQKECDILRSNNNVLKSQVESLQKYVDKYEPRNESSESAKEAEAERVKAYKELKEVAYKQHMQIVKLKADLKSPPPPPDSNPAIREAIVKQAHKLNIDIVDKLDHEIINEFGAHINRMDAEIEHIRTIVEKRYHNSSTSTICATMSTRLTAEPTATPAVAFAILLESANNQFVLLDEEIATVRACNEEITAERDTYHERSSNYRMENDGLVAERERYRAVLAAHEEQLAKISNLQIEVSNKAETIVSLESSLESWRKAFTEKAETAAIKMADLQTENDELKSKYDAATQNVTWRTEMENLIANKNSAKAELSALQSEISKLKAREEELRFKEDSIIFQTENIDNEYAAIEYEKEQLQRQREQFKTPGNRSRTDLRKELGDRSLAQLSGIAHENSELLEITNPTTFHSNYARLLSASTPNIETEQRQNVSPSSPELRSVLDEAEAGAVGHLAQGGQGALEAPAPPSTE